VLACGRRGVWGVQWGGARAPMRNGGPPHCSRPAGPPGMPAGRRPSSSVPQRSTRPRRRPPPTITIPINGIASHMTKSSPDRARKRSVSTTAAQTTTYVGVSICSRRHPRSARPNCSTGTTRKRQQPGLRCSGRVIAPCTDEKERSSEMLFERFNLACRLQILRPFPGLPQLCAVLPSPLVYQTESSTR